MMELKLSEAAAITEARLLPGNAADSVIRGVAIDTRQLLPGNLFAAFKGEQVDGHAYLPQAQAAGAAAALVTHPVASELPQLVVKDALQALHALAANWRQRFSLPVVGITGSNGKTTVKQMLASILDAAGSKALVTSGNRNNELGLPLMLLELNQQHQAAVLEMGAGQPGDIQLLAALAQPDIGVITHIGPAHLERLGSLRGVAKTKGELLAGLPSGGLAIFPDNARHVELLRQAAGSRRSQTFGTADSADMRWSTKLDELHLRSTQQHLVCWMQVPGEHNCSNAAAAAMAALALGIEPGCIVQGLNDYQGYHGRLQRKPGVHGAVIVDDSYNANPASLAAALDALAVTDRSRERWLALGDMGELGNAAERLHRQAGEQARTSGIQHLFATGELCRAAVQGFGAGAQHYPDQPAMIAELRRLLHQQVTLLVKGSRAAGMERVVEALTLPATEHSGSAGRMG